MFSKLAFIVPTHLRKGPFKCYVVQMGMRGGGGSNFPEKKRYEGVRYNVISVTRRWVGVKFTGKKRYITLEWPLNDTSTKIMIITVSQERLSL